MNAIFEGVGILIGIALLCLGVVWVAALWDEYDVGERLFHLVVFLGGGWMIIHGASVDSPVWVVFGLIACGSIVAIWYTEYR